MLIYLFLTAIFVTIVTSLGGLWLSRQSQKLSRFWMSFLVSLGAGVLLNIAFFEYLPHASVGLKEETGLWILIGLVSMLLADLLIAPRLGFLERLFGSKKASSHAHSHDNCDHEHVDLDHSHIHLLPTQGACSAIGCLVVCTFFDGIQMATAFSLDIKTGFLVAAGLLFHVLPDGILAAGLAMAGGLNTRIAFVFSLIVGCALFAGTLIAYLVGFNLGLSPYLMAFSVGVILYVTLLHLFPIALKEKSGFIFLLISILVFAAYFNFTHSHHHHSFLQK